MNAPGGAASPVPSLKRGGLAAHVPFFYGWVMLPVAALAMVCTTPGQTLGVSLFFTHLTDTLGVTKTDITRVYMFGTLLAATPQALIGAMMDRYGIRRTMAAIIFGLGIACWGAGQVHGLWGLFFAFFFLRMLGQGALSLTAGNTLPMWFNQKLGRVVGLMSLGVGVGFAVAPKLIQYFIDTHGWRTAYALLGVVVWAVMLPVLLLVYRNRPEDVGQQVDGAGNDERFLEESGPIKTSKGPALKDLTLPQALRTRSFWCMALIGGLWAMGGTAIVFFIKPLTESMGLTEQDAASVLSVFWLFFAGCQFVGGFLADTFKLHYLLSIAMTMITGGLLVAIHTDSAQLAMTYGALLGGAQGLSAAVGTTAWVRYYGRGNLGKIKGSVNMSMVGFSSLGPLFMSMMYDAFGDYKTCLWVFVGLFAPMILVALLATPPAREPREEPPPPEPQPAN